MRHGKKINHLGRTASHRAALLSNMASSLILHKRIYTTVAKAKALRTYVEPLITRSKTDSTHSRRMVFSYLQNKEAIKELFGEVSTKVATRPGGYTRIIKTGFRPGDNAETCLMELVDYNTVYNPKGDKAAGATRRTRRGRKPGIAADQVAIATAAAATAAIPDFTSDEEATSEVDAATLHNESEGIEATPEINLVKNEDVTDTAAPEAVAEVTHDAEAAPAVDDIALPEAPTTTTDNNEATPEA